jgi:hypothetical protein
MPLELTREQFNALEDVLISAWKARTCICDQPCGDMVPPVFAYVRDLVLEAAARECEAQQFGYHDTKGEAQEQIAASIRALKG